MKVIFHCPKKSPSVPDKACVRIKDVNNCASFTSLNTMKMMTLIAVVMLLIMAMLMVEIVTLMANVLIIVTMMTTTAVMSTEMMAKSDDGGGGLPSHAPLSPPCHQER